MSNRIPLKSVLICSFVTDASTARAIVPPERRLQQQNDHSEQVMAHSEDQGCKGQLISQQSQLRSEIAQGKKKWSTCYFSAW